ncbi:Cytochrome P450 6j1, partial [Gryllus bimaculatus]
MGAAAASSLGVEGPPRGVNQVEAESAELPNLPAGRSQQHCGWVGPGDSRVGGAETRGSRPRRAAADGSDDHAPAQEANNSGAACRKAACAMGLAAAGALAYAAALLCAALAAAYLYFTRHFRHWAAKGVPHERPLPFVGNFKDVVLMRTSMGLLAKEVYERRKREPFVGLFAFDQPVLQIHDLALARAVLVKDFHAFTDRSCSANARVDPLPVRSLFALTGDRWKRSRAALTPSFTSGKMKRMYQLGNTLADPDAAFRRTLLQHFEFSPRRALVMATAWFAPALIDLLGLKVMKQEVEDFVRGTIITTIRQREKDQAKRNDLLDSLIQLKQAGSIEDAEDQGEQMANKLDVCAHSFAFLMAGFETTASTLNYMLFELARNDAVQDKLRKEIQEAIIDGSISYETLHGLKYLDMVMQETLRKYPPLPFISRTSTSKYTLPGTNVTLEKGSRIILPMYGFHMDPDFHRNPKIFDPDRFSEENKRNIPNYSFMPFSEGPRNCIALLAAAAFLFCTRHFAHWSSKGVAGPRPLPLVGSLKDVVLMRKPIGVVAKEVYDEHRAQPYVGLFAFDEPVLQIHDLALARAVLVKDFQ